MKEDFLDSRAATLYLNLVHYVRDLVKEHFKEKEDTVEDSIAAVTDLIFAASGTSHVVFATVLAWLMLAGKSPSAAYKKTCELIDQAADTSKKKLRMLLDSKGPEGMVPDSLTMAVSNAVAEMSHGEDQ